MGSGTQGAAGADGRAGAYYGEGRPLVLASGSPRRKELLSRLGVHFVVRVAGVDEDFTAVEPVGVVRELSLRKARAVATLSGESCVLAADTIVVLDGEVLNKPETVAENAEFIRRLSGRWHEVFTGLALLTPAGEHFAFERTGVLFRGLSEEEIQGYAASGEGLDKAGGYGIQERGMALVERLDGDYFNVVGLPITRLVLLAREAGLELLDWAGGGAA
jgi:septum formation protein